jgi:hypothetical protein
MKKSKNDSAGAVEEFRLSEVDLLRSKLADAELNTARLAMNAAHAMMETKVAEFNKLQVELNAKYTEGGKYEVVQPDGGGPSVDQTTGAGKRRLKRRPSIIDEKPRA